MAGIGEVVVVPPAGLSWRRDTPPLRSMPDMEGVRESEKETKAVLSLQPSHLGSV